MKYFGLLCIMTTAMLGYTQSPDTLWTRTYGGAADDVGNSIGQTSDGGYIIAGYTESFGTGQQDVWLLKIDATGDTVWTKTYGGINNDWAVAVRPTCDGGYVILANTESFGSGGNDIWLIKTDHLGNIIWASIYDSGYQCDAGFDVQQTSDGGYIVAGSTFSDNFISPYAVLLLKTDAEGDSVWCQTYDSGALDAAGCHVCETFDGGYVVAGYRAVAPEASSVARKVDVNGDTLWVLQPWAGRFYCVKEDNDSACVVCGVLWMESGIDVWALLYTVKVDSQGDILWTRTYGTFTNQMIGHSFDMTNDNAYILTGQCGDVFFNPDVFLFKMNENGNSLWCLVYGGAQSDLGNDVLQTNDGGYIVVGYTESYGAGGRDVYLIRTEPDVGIEENEPAVITQKGIITTIFRGPLQLPEGKKCRVFDITGRGVEPTRITCGIYYIEVDGEISQKVIKIR